MNSRKYATISFFGIAASVISLLAIAGCKDTSALLPHKLVATAGEHSIPMYPDEPTFLKVAGRAQQGGVSGAVGDVQKQFEAKQIDDQTAVDIVSSDSNGAEVRISNGPMRGQIGFVAAQNVD
ncbi:MAG TPA: hypothetical protein VKS22_10500 [Candidatus Binataceae bacterium]|nr:hypothetical protein [Candidatus Binataceae bacterium]